MNADKWDRIIGYLSVAIFVAAGIIVTFEIIGGAR